MTAPQVFLQTDQQIGAHPLRPVMLQRWESLTFLHWPYEPAVIRALLPPQVKLDTFNGAAWVGLAPFLLSNLRAPYLPAVPWLGKFPETNVRTYVLGPDGKPAVWFFTLEADRLAAVLGARAVYKLPYRWADMSVKRVNDVVQYRSRRRAAFGSGQTDIAIRPGLPFKANAFDDFLTARFRLYTVYRQRLLTADIEHAPWPLQSGEVLRMDENLIENSGVPRPVGTPVVHFSESLDVRVGWIRRANPS